MTVADSGHSRASVVTVCRIPGTDLYTDAAGLLRMAVHPHPDGTATARPLAGSPLHGRCLHAHPLGPAPLLGPVLGR